VGEVRGVGLMACIECVADRESNNPLALDKEVGKRIDKHIARNWACWCGR
jgi:adenosylmethionine-8-amino-7-oxononanoate aminotransferase